MKLAIISDLHLGDPTSVMAFKAPDSQSTKKLLNRYPNLALKFGELKPNEIAVGKRYHDFVKTIKEKIGNEPLDYLILLGDVLDFSIDSYTSALEIGKCFFKALQNDNVAKEIIYCPGNHDFDIWNTVEYQVNIIQKISNGKNPTQFRMSIPGIIDDRQDSKNKGLTLFNVKRKQMDDNSSGYGGLFLDNITQPEPTLFNFVFPNIYLVTDDETLLITHGQYLEMYWSILGKWAPIILGKDLKIKDPKCLNIKEMVSINFPLCQLGCSAIGQAGPLTCVIQKLEVEIKEHNTSRVRTYFDNLENELKNMGNFKGFKGFFQHMFFKIARNKTINALKHFESITYKDQFLEDPKVKNRFVEFYNSTVAEIKELNQNEHQTPKIPYPTRMIFGHTHQPISWKSGDLHITVKNPADGKEFEFKMHNTGGWMGKPDDEKKEDFCGAEVFFYETGKGFSSTAIGYNPDTPHPPKCKTE